MKIGVLGDSHRNKKAIDMTIKKLKSEDVDLILHTGDNFRDSIYINEAYNLDIIAVKGNCDFENVEEDLVFDIKGKKIFLTHGHKYLVKYGVKELFEKAKYLNCDIVVFGHSHIPHLEKVEDIYILNPGSVSLPRGGSQKSFAIIEILDSKINIEHMLLD
ncbi:MAG: metallophosphoesterase [Peptostreptococcaceae bacterium]|jgi:putative phosphoesterase|nr:metallophosphoesterase [Peptostreptococcaceae bacterium]